VNSIALKGEEWLRGRIKPPPSSFCFGEDPSVGEGLNRFRKKGRGRGFIAKIYSRFSHMV
jgi:hypothetical protein